MKIRSVWDLIKQTFKEYSQDKAARLCAAIAYYTIFAIAPILILSIALSSLVLGDIGARRITEGLADVVGNKAATAITSMIKARSTLNSSATATVIGFATLLIGALGLFGSLQDALNTVWGVYPRPGRGIWGTLSERFASFTALLGTCFILLVSLILSTAIATMSAYFSQYLPLPASSMQLISFFVSFFIITLLFAMIYKVLPDAKIAWKDVWIGSSVTSLLFSFGKWLIGLYLGRSTISSSYGAAGSLIAVLLWVYYSAQILLVGAEFTKVYANRYGSRVLPDRHAVLLTDLERAKQGIPKRDQLENAIKNQTTRPTTKPG